MNEAPAGHPECYSYLVNGRPVQWWGRLTFETEMDRERAYSAILRAFHDAPGANAQLILRKRAAENYSLGGLVHIDVAGESVARVYHVMTRHGVPTERLTERPRFTPYRA